MRLVVSVTHGTDDPTQANLGILAALAAAEQGHEVTLWLQGEGAALANREVYPFVQGVNMPPVKDAMEDLIARGVPIWVCKACAVGRNVGEGNAVTGTTLKTMGDFVGAVAEADKNIDF